jgi:hypothetical protein
LSARVRPRWVASQIARMLMYTGIQAARKVAEALSKKGMGTALAYGGTVVASLGGVAYSAHAGLPPLAVPRLLVTFQARCSLSV